MSLPPTGSLMNINETNRTVEDPSIERKSVRIYGILQDHDFRACMAILKDPKTEEKLQLDTQSVEPFSARVGTFVQVIGEIETTTDDQRVTNGGVAMLRCRVLRSMDGVDIHMYNKALKVQTEFLTSCSGPKI
ncbi:unnamed protein product [Owenia fusiformis]|uniref:Uncharacterized protein n=1 Tax=Owenia fusiformis TaxID=6347 RepID=A0A8J1TVQ1_OWEFU|nr:unnamed protein product [Owenia fusiformis]